ncbi:MAG: hypothetical protein V7L29_33035 [Nostoc sp.]|uniref:hypothetical protein n=1 Tax=Nostoc sp. TaxID=1180 RepID=UPI002FFC2CAA
MTEAAFGCAKHGFVTAEVTSETTEAAFGCAKHGFVTAEVTSETTEAAFGCAKHGFVMAEVTSKTTEVASGCAKHKFSFSFFCLVWSKLPGNRALYRERITIENAIPKRGRVKIIDIELMRSHKAYGIATFKA